MNHCLIKADSEVVIGSYEIKDGTTVIADDAFYRCTNLESITIPNSVITIGDDAFYRCTGFTDVTIPDSVVTLGDYAFYYCTNLASIKISESVTSIGISAFNSCTCLASVTIPDGVTSIGYYAFYRCTGLTNITIGDGVTSIGSDAFSETAFYNNESNWENDVLYLSHYLIDADRDVITGAYEIKDGTTVIANAAFYRCKNLTSITIPDSVTVVGRGAFWSCTSLSEITFEGDAPSMDEFASSSVTATAYYPAYNSTWTADVLQDYGGTITWVAYDTETGEVVETPYTDVLTYQWFYESIQWAYEKSFMNGRSEDTFAPDDTMTRAEFVTVLYRMENGEDEYTTENDNPFTDVSSTQWFYKYVMWAYDNEIVNGTTATTFDPDGAITREQIATILYRLYGEKTEYDLSSYPDADEISSYAEEAVQWAVSIGLIKGNDDGTLDPQGNATRAQVATIYMRYVEGE